MSFGPGIAEAARIVPLERLALSPQCGFASTHEGNRLTTGRPALEARAGRAHGQGNMGLKREKGKRLGPERGAKPPSERELGWGPASK